MRRIVFGFLILLFASLVAAAWYAYDKGFTRKWRNYVTSEFRKRGVEVSLRRLNLHPLRGIVAKDLRVYDAREHKRTLAVIDEMRLVINWANLVQGKTFLDALDLHDANLDFPLDPTNARGSKVEIDHLSGRLFLAPQQIYLSHLEADLYGIHVTASGRVINPQAFRPKPNAATNESASINTIQRVIEELEALHFEADPPQLQLRFSGDLALPDQVLVDAALWAEKVRRNSYRLNNLYVAATFRNGVVDLRQLTATDDQGAIRAGGHFELATKALTLQLRSTLDIQNFVRGFGRLPALDEFVFYGPPAIDMTAEAKLTNPPDIKVLGHLNVPRFGCKSVIFEGFDADASWDGERWSARDVRLVHRSGTITGDVMQLPQDFRTRLKSSINPKALAPLLTGKTAEWFSQFDFIDAPAIDIEARGAAPSLDSLVVDGTLGLGRSSYRGVGADSFAAAVRYQNRQLVFDPFRVQRTEGLGSGAMTFDFLKNEVRFDHIHSSLQPSEIAIWIDRDMVKNVVPYRFKAKPPNLLIDGVVHTKGGTSTNLRIDVDAPGGMDYTFLKRNLSFAQISGKLFFAQDHMRIDNLTAILFSGKLHGNAEISLVPGKPEHSAELQLENVDFSRLTKLYFGYEDAKGKLNATYRFSGRGDDSRTMNGAGEMTVTEGQVFAIPFLGPFSGILDSIVPGMGHDVARRASASFSVSDGAVSTNDLQIIGTGFSMFGHGELYFIDDRMDFDMRVNAQGLPGVVLFPVSKLFEYTADGKLSKPVWRPKVLPRL